MYVSHTCREPHDSAALRYSARAGRTGSADVDRLSVQSVRLSVFSAQTSMPDASID
jgi:hypothetical protein